MGTDGDLKLVVTISASINTHPSESSRKGHSLKSILWYLKLTQKLLRKKSYSSKVLDDLNVSFSYRCEVILRAFFVFFPEGREINQISYSCLMCHHANLQIL